GHRALSEHKTLSVSWSHYPPSEEQLFQAFKYYFDNDAFIEF
ncbi:DUF7716 domain-containing protein, partial [Enterobacter sichuanensis]